MSNEEPDGFRVKKQSRILLPLGILLFIGFFLSTTISLGIARKFIRESILKSELPLSSDNIYSEIQRDLFQPILISSLMANDTFVHNWLTHGEKDIDAIQRYLDRIKNRYHTVSSFLISEATKNYYYSKGISRKIQEDKPEDDWYFRVRNGHVDYEINVDVDYANEKYMTIFVNYRITDHAGNFLGITGVGLGVDSVQKLMQVYHERFQRNVYFYNTNGELVLSSTADSDGVKSAHPDTRLREAITQIIKQIHRNGKGSYSLSVEGESGGLNHLRYIPELDWILVITQPSDSTRTIFFKIIGLNLLVCLGTTLLLLKIIHTIMLRNYHRLQQKNKELARTTHQVAEQAQELVEANAKLDLLIREKNDFMGIIVHDLNNPLNSILGFSELLAKDESLSTTPTDYARHIYSDAKSMQEQVEELLRLSELSEDYHRPMKKLDIHSLVRHAIDRYDFQAQTKGIEIRLNIPDEPVFAMADESLLVSSISNLLSNAIKYSPKGGRIEVAIIQRQGQLEILVADEGPGLSEDDQKLLFKKFERLDPRPTANENSTGLGLYLVQQMMQRMQGSVRCESKKGIGSTFILTIPSTR